LKEELLLEIKAIKFYILFGISALLLFLSIAYNFNIVEQILLAIAFAIAGINCIFTEIDIARKVRKK